MDLPKRGMKQPPPAVRGAGSRRYRMPALGAVAAAVLTVEIMAGGGAAMAQPAQTPQEKTMERTITVSGTGSVMAEPDVARLTAGLVVEGATAQAALAANTTAMRKVIAEVKARGIEAKDVQTSSFHVEPVYVHPKDGQPPRISGYRVTNQITVTVRALDSVGDVLDRLVTSGANQVHGLVFEVSKADSLKDEARKIAVANALRRAKLLAAAAGAEVGRVLQIAEDAEGGPPQPVFRAKAMSAGAAPIERGSQALEARVTATWELK